MVSDGVNRTLKKTIYDKYAKKGRRNRSQDVSEFYFKKAYGYSVSKQKKEHAREEDKVFVNADKTMRRLWKEYEEFTV